MDIQQIRNLILDLDGVLWRGETPVTSLPAFFAELADLGIRAVAATNNAAKTPEEYLAKFARFGVMLEPWQIVTSAEATGGYLARHAPPGSRVFVLGAAGLIHAVRSRGFPVINRMGALSAGRSLADVLAEQGSADIVAVGFTPEATYADFAQAAYHIGRGAQFIGSNPDVSLPTELGPLPGAGALLALLEAATGARPLVIGKPARHMFDEALQRLGGTRQDTAMVGDRLNTDIAGAQKAKLASILVLSGVTDLPTLAMSRVRPTFVFDDIAHLARALRQARGDRS